MFSSTILLLNLLTVQDSKNFQTVEAARLNELISQGFSGENKPTWPMMSEFAEENNHRVQLGDIGRREATVA